MSERHLHDFNLMMNAVRAFQKKFNQEYSGPPREMPASVASLRKKLTLEEATELVLAIDRGELDEQLDALIDQLYVLIGTALQLGFTPDIVVAAFWRVHHANMQKVLAPSRQASKRDSAWDIVKPEGWVKPDLTDLVRREQ